MIARLRRLIEREVSRRHAGAQRDRTAQHDHQQHAGGEAPGHPAERPQHQQHHGDADRHADDPGAGDREHVGDGSDPDDGGQHSVAVNQRARNETGSATSR